MTDARADNSAQFLTTAVQTLAGAGIQTWVFGGWAEELWGLCPPRPHGDIDLLYPSEDFRRLDAFIADGADVEEILPKRFAHKRAFRWRGVLCEVFLLRHDGGGYLTDFFGTYAYRWPEDTLAHTIPLLDSPVPTASPEALRLYRERHGEVEEAYRRHQRGAGHDAV